MRIKPTANPTKKLEYDVQTGKACCASALR